MIDIPYTVERRADTGVNNVTLGIWLFLASEVMLFGGLFSAYALLRAGSTNWPHGAHELSVPVGLLNTIVILAASAFMAAARRSAAAAPGRARLWLALSAAAGLAFLVVKGAEYASKFEHGVGPATSTFYAVYFLLTGVHALHVAGGVIVSACFAAAGIRSARGNTAMFANRIAATALYWYFVDLVWMAVFVSLYIV